MVAEAIADSALESMELGLRKTNRQLLTPRHLASHEALLRGLARCRTLQHLTIGHSDLLAHPQDLLPKPDDGEPTQRVPGGPLHQVFEYFDDSKDAPFKSVTLKGYVDNAQHPDAPTQQFITAISRLPSLTSVQLQCHSITPDGLRTQILAPLAGHAKLARLEISANLEVECFSNPLLSSVTTLIASCPRLTHLHLPVRLQTDESDIDRLNAFRAQGHPLDPISDLTLLKKLQARKTPLPLLSLQMGGTYMAPSSLKTLLAMMAPGKALGNVEHLHLSGCILDLPTTLQWFEFKAPFSCIVDLALPPPHQYCLTTQSGDVQFATIEEPANSLLIEPQKKLDELRKPLIAIPSPYPSA